MKNLQKTSFIGLFLVALALMSFTLFQFGRGPGKGAKGEAREEVKAYMEQHVLPVMKAQRAKLETQLSSTDKAAIAQIREKLDALRADRKEFREGHERGTPPTDAEMAEREALHSQHQRLMLEASAIAFRYIDAIDGLFAEISTEKAAWRKDIHAIMEKYRPADNDSTAVRGRGPQGGKGRGGKGGGMGPGAGMHNGMGQGPGGMDDDADGFGGRGRGHLGGLPMMDPVKFLLWDGQSLPQRGNMGVQVSPNPATNEVTVDFQLPKAANVALTIVDNQGNTVKTLPAHNGTEGVNSLTINTADLPKGLYFLRIATADSQVTKRFLVK